jgi:hypothetical protein
MKGEIEMKRPSLAPSAKRFAAVLLSLGLLVAPLQLSRRRRLPKGR